jgi:hypothetical protein
VSNLKNCLYLSPCELLMLEAGSVARRQFGNPEEGECQPMEAVTKRLVKTQQVEKT